MAFECICDQKLCVRRSGPRVARSVKIGDVLCSSAVHAYIICKISVYLFIFDFYYKTDTVRTSVALHYEKNICTNRKKIHLGTSCWVDHRAGDVSFCLRRSCAST